MTGSPIGVVRHHPVVAYYALAFTISFGAILLAVGPDGMWGVAATIVVSGVVALSGPSLSGLLMTGVIDGRAGLRALRSRLLRWRVAARWYLVALLTGPAVMAATLLALSVGDPSFVPAIATSDDRLGLLTMAVMSGLSVATFEELGWTGFALPHLRQHHGVVASGIVMGVLWSVWHFPFFSGSTDPDGIVPSWLLVTILLFAWLPPFRVLMAQVYDRTESVLLAILMHAPAVACMYLLETDVSGTGRVVIVLTWGAAFWLIAGLAAWSRSRTADARDPARLQGQLAA